MDANWLGLLITVFDVTSPDMETRPIVHCLLAKRLPDGEYLVKKGDPFTLEEAADFATFGWEVFVDPWDLEALTRWEQMQRTKPRWNQW